MIKLYEHKSGAKCPSTAEWINKMWHIHTTEYYLVVKTNELLMHAAFNLGNITQSEGSQSQMITNPDSICLKCLE